MKELIERLRFGASTDKDHELMMEASQVLQGQAYALERMVADEKQHCAMIDALKGDKQFLDAKCERLTAELAESKLNHDICKGAYSQMVSENAALRADLAKRYETIGEMAMGHTKTIAERDALRADAVLYYNSGYMAGHHDTVESQFTDIHQSDIRTYHADVVAEIAGENK